MGAEVTRIDGLLQGYLPRTRLQRISLAQHQLATSPVGDRQRMALATVGQRASSLLVGVRPPPPRRP